MLIPFTLIAIIWKQILPTFATQSLVCKFLYSSKLTFVLALFVSISTFDNENATQSGES
uniref:Uncharacterized protein n=1 Tax=Rhizophora mucronata TaxID=61149 RepID=A0A2P2QAA5_RHIMU